MKKRIFKSMGILSMLSVIITAAAVFALMYREVSVSVRSALADEAVYLAAALEQGGIEYLEALEDTDAVDRVTWIDSDGTVLYENVANAEEMENHADRPEVQEAFETGSGEDARKSDTIGIQVYYYALLLEDGTVLRVSTSADTAFGLILPYVPYVIAICVLVAVFAMVLGNWLANKIIDPINNLNLEDPLEGEPYEEISPLLVRIARQNASIEANMRALREQQEEFNAITSNMNEGLIVLDNRAQVLSLNTMARKVFEVNTEGYIHHNILRINRSAAMQKAVEAGLTAECGEEILSMGGRKYQILSNPVIYEDRLKGIILLILDVTEREILEEQRREFTANVSHELKTPLQSISGYAEILKNGMVNPEDVPRFSERIYDEARRLIQLTEDIIRISRLDEYTEAQPQEWVELRALSIEVADRLSGYAEEKGVRILVSGLPVQVLGDSSILEEMIYNLCENAVKYNKPDGTVEIHVENDAEHPKLTVSDTGIGIPEESQSRVFERFYRVDKSRSKETGGTGLGLSIVKHAAMFHRAEIDLKSRLGEGTQITVTFPSAFPEERIRKSL